MNNILNSVTEPPIGSLITLIMEVATARAIAIAANAICFTFSLLLLSLAKHPIVINKTQTIINTTYPEPVRPYETLPSSSILLTKKFIIFLSLSLILLYPVKNIHIFTKSQALKKRATGFYHLLLSNILSITFY